MMNTVEVVKTILVADPDVPIAVAQRVENTLADALGDTSYVTEAQAAALLNIHRTTLSRWRRGKWAGAPRPFPFTPRRAPTGKMLYAEREIRKEARRDGAEE